MSQQFTQIHQSIEDINQKGGRGNFAVFLADSDKNYYVQIAGAKNSNAYYLEAVSNKNLSQQYSLDNLKLNLLNQLGWKTPNQEIENFYYQIEVKNNEERVKIAEFIFETLKQVYELNLSSSIKIDLVLE